MSDAAEPAGPREMEAGRGLSLDWVRIFWRRKSLVILGTVVGLVGGILYYAQAPPVYESVSQVLLVKKRPETMAGLNNLFDLQDQLPTHQTLVKSPVIIEQAIKTRKLRELASLADAEDPVEAIALSLGTARATARATSKDILQLTYRGRDPEDCAAILNALVECYKEFLAETYQNIGDDTLRSLTEAARALRAEIEKKEKDYETFRLTSPVIVKGKDNNDNRNERLTGIEAKRAAMLLRQAELELYIKVVEDGIRGGARRESLLAMLTEAKPKLSDQTRLGGTPTFQDQIVQMQNEEQKLLENYGPNHPEVQSLRRRQEALRQLAELPESAYIRLTELVNPAGGTKPRSDTLELHLQVLRDELAQTKVADRSLSELHKHELEEARRLDSYAFQDDNFRNDLIRSQQLYDGIIKRLQDVDLNKGTGGYDARVTSWAKPGRKVGPRILLVFPAALLLGLIMGGGLAYLVELGDQSFHTPEEIRRQLGLPVVGHIPVLTANRPTGSAPEPTAIPLDPLLCTYHRSKSPAAEAYRGVRTALYFSAQSTRHKVFAVTSPNAGDGKSTAIANLAVSIAQSGRKVILLDADFRRSRQHEIFGLKNEAGLATAIDGTADYKEGTLATAVPGLFLLPAGPHPDNPAELLTSAKFEDILAALREDYDFVLIDAPPLLAVSDPSIVASRVDAMLLVIRISKNVRADAVRAKEILKTVGATILGVLVNGVGQGAGRGYATYYSGYGYYSYGYGTNSAGNNHYLEDVETPDGEAEMEHPRASKTATSAARSGSGSSKKTRPGRSWLSRLFPLDRD